MSILQKGRFCSVSITSTNRKPELKRCKHRSMDLLGSDSSGEDNDVSFKINENYAKNYQKWRKKEERQKLIDKYGDVESSSSEEEEEVRSTPQLDKDWLRTYAVVRFRQPRLYKQGEKFFKEVIKPVVKKKEKSVTLKDHERKFILEKGGVESDEDTRPPKTEGKGYFEEQEEIKKSFQKALADSSDEDSDEGGSGLLVKNQKTAEEQSKEENDYLEWLKGGRDDLDDKEAAEELAPLKAYWNDPNLNEKEKVLRDYILNNGYMDQEDSSDEDISDDNDNADDAEKPHFASEEEFLEKAEEYEHKYNFRHEEPGGDELKSYPRVIETSVRTKDTRRVEKRQRRMDRQKLEGEKRKEEIKLLQRLQQEEKMEKLEALRKMAKNPSLDYDLEADFDPEKHNKIMQKFFNADYYDEDDAGEKPVFDYDAAIDEAPGDWWQERLQEESGKDEEAAGGSKEDDNNVGGDGGEQEEYEPGADDPNFIMDADYDPTRDYKAEKKRRKKYGKALAQKLPLFDPTTKTFDEYIDEYLKDKIDKIPFPYREVLSNDFGLSTEEILKANEKELNAWVSVRKMSQYCSKQEELMDKRKFSARARNEQKKLKVLPSLLDKQRNDDADNDEKKEKKKRKKKKGDLTEDSVPASESATEDLAASKPTSDKAVKRKRDKCEESPMKSKKKKWEANPAHSERVESGKKMLECGLVANSGDGGGSSSSVCEVLKKKKKKKKHPDSLQQPKSDPVVKVNQKGTKDLNSHRALDQKGTVSLKEEQKKEKRLKLQQNSLSLDNLATKPADLNESVRKQQKKKKKVAINNFTTKAIGGQGSKPLSNKKIAKELSKVMSSARLSKYGIGANAVKTSGSLVKNNRKKKSKEV